MTLPLTALAVMALAVFAVRMLARRMYGPSAPVGPSPYSTVAGPLTGYGLPPGAVSVTDARITIRLTPLAADRVRHYMAAEGLGEHTTAIVVGVRPDATYSFDLQERPPGTADVEPGGPTCGLRVEVEPGTADLLDLLDGLTIDYRQTHEGVGFVFENPNVRGARRPTPAD